MIDLTKDLQNAIISADGKPFLLETDYRVWIRFMQDFENDSEDRDISYIFKDEVPLIDDFILQQLRMFLYNPSVTPQISTPSEEKTLDYILDGEYIFSALYATYGIDIMEMKMHWHKFLALCNNIISDKTLWGYAKQMRGYKKPSKSDTYEKACLKAKKEWSFPVVLTEEQQKKKQEFDDYFG